MPADPDQLLTVAAVAARLGVTEGQVRALIAYGRLRAVNVSTGGQRSRWRVRPDDLETFCRERSNRQYEPKPARRRKVLAEYTRYV